MIGFSPRHPGLEGADLNDTKRLILTGGELRDHPGWWKIGGRMEDESQRWSFVRKPDGTYWEVAAVDLFPRSGGIMRIDLGDQIQNQKTLAQCEEYYSQLKQKAEEKAAQSEDATVDCRSKSVILEA